MRNARLCPENERDNSGLWQRGGCRLFVNELYLKCWCALFLKCTSGSLPSFLVTQQQSSQNTIEQWEKNLLFTSFVYHGSDTHSIHSTGISRLSFIKDISFHYYLRNHYVKTNLVESRGYLQTSPPKFLVEFTSCISRTNVSTWYMENLDHFDKIRRLTTNLAVCFKWRTTFFVKTFCSKAKPFLFVFG